MKRLFIFACVLVVFFSINSFAQIPTNTLVQIVKAEDERRWDSTLENLLNNPKSEIRKRAALAIGRIGDEKALPALISHLHDSPEVIAMVLFAFGEIESIKESEEILEFLKNTSQLTEIRIQAIEAAGKIVAANAKDEKAIELGKEILKNLEIEAENPKPNSKLVSAALTAVLRARPEGAENVVVKFLDFADSRVKADALNTLARLRAKNANEKSRQLLATDNDPVVRANAARLLGVGEDKTALDLLVKAATEDEDSRVRVSAIRALGSLKDASVAEKFIPLFRARLAAEEVACKAIKALNDSKNVVCDLSKNEHLEIASTLGRLLPNTENQKAIDFLTKFSELDEYQSPEIEIAFVQIAPNKFDEYQRNKKDTLKRKPQAVRAMMQGITEIAKLSESEENNTLKEIASKEACRYVKNRIDLNENQDITLSEALNACVAFKLDVTNKVFLEALKHKDPIVKATAAGILAEQSFSNENFNALKTAFASSLLTDKKDNDAQLAILDALFKLDKKESVGTLLTALNATDYLVRKKAYTLLKTDGLEKDYPALPTILENFLANKKNQVLPYNPAFGTKLGQVLNSNADYIRAVSRKNGKVKAVLTTTKGSFTIDLMPEDAPLTVDNFIKLAKSNYFNGLAVHRVVPNFVMQDGDPRGDGSGGPGWSIRCEINTLQYGRGAVGMALSGKDTGGSQWFVTHSPQPHLDGGYTIFGQVNEADMKVVDSIVRGDKIISVRITGDSVSKSPRKKK